MFKTLSGLFESFERPHRIYVMPTRAGVLMLVMNLFLILMSAVYSSPSVQLLGFFLFALYGLGMTWTHAQLRGLSQLKLHTRANFAFESGLWELHGHSSAKESRAGLSVRVRLKKGQQKEELASTTFEMNGDGSLRPHPRVDVTLRRGRWAVTRAGLETRAPFGLFRAWVRLPVAGDLIVYPARMEAALPVGSPGQAEREASATTEEDFASVFESARLDRANHVVPRPSSNESLMILKKFESPMGGRPSLRWSELEGDLERRLSICAAAAVRYPGLEVDTPYVRGRLETDESREAALTAWAEA
ncbi:MAG: hypothetical protein KF681_13840 [Bdellovibrionaceae bacterium]|nr:hypothetical protein [Pseudobdellovibrionaceae bacterium]